MTSLSKTLLLKAKEAATRSYSPYSKISVGAALETEDSKIFTGCNIENASYGLTICAERVSIHNAIINLDKPLKIKRLAVCRADDVPISPCGSCRQVIADFSDLNTEIIFYSEEGIQVKRISELLPNSFKLEK